MKFMIGLIFAFALGGCTVTYLMPSSNEQTIGDVGWRSYADAERFFVQIKVGKSTISDVSKLGLDLRSSKNVIVLDRTSLLALFMANVPGGLEYIDDAVKQCFKPGENCTPYVFRKDEVKEDGRGSLLLRVLNFKKESTVRGWSVEMLILASELRNCGQLIFPIAQLSAKTTEHPLGCSVVYVS